MLATTDPRDALALLNERGRRFHDDTTAERARRGSDPRRALAASLRRVANRLDPPALAHRLA